MKFFNTTKFAHTNVYIVENCFSITPQMTSIFPIFFYLTIHAQFCPTKRLEVYDVIINFGRPSNLPKIERHLWISPHA